MQKIIKFLKEVRETFQSITWPKKEALIQLTIVVISISIIISLILGGFDYLFTNSISFLGNFRTTPNTIEQSVTPTTDALPTVASTSGTFTK
jgi:preprotein translocase subunit SecE